jgi:hypothetical protein
MIDETVSFPSSHDTCSSEKARTDELSFEHLRSFSLDALESLPSLVILANFVERISPLERVAIVVVVREEGKRVLRSGEMEKESELGLGVGRVRRREGPHCIYAQGKAHALWSVSYG